MSVLDYNLWPEIKGFCHTLRLLCIENPKLLLRCHIEFVIIELPKIGKKYLNKPVADFIDTLDIKEQWAYCIFNSANLTLADWRLIEQRKPEMKDFVNALRQASRKVIEIIGNLVIDFDKKVELEKLFEPYKQKVAA